MRSTDTVSRPVVTNESPTRLANRVADRVTNRLADRVTNRVSSRCLRCKSLAQMVWVSELNWVEGRPMADRWPALVFGLFRHQLIAFSTLTDDL